MPHFYELRPDQSNWATRNSIVATRRWKIPGIHCPLCGVWALTGIIYPTVKLSDFNSIVLPTTPTPLPIEQFHSLADSIQLAIGTRRVVRPGTELGPLRGKAKGSFGDFAWVNPWTPLIRESLWLAFNESENPLAGAQPELDFGAVTDEAFVEIEAEPAGNFLRETAPEKCAICGRLTMNKPGFPHLSAKSLDASLPLQRLIEHPTVLIANESFARFILNRRLQDVILTPLEIH